ncbi:MAG TPA: glycosyltransferase [Gammaproteobacteria bacterium]|nr:glycosyltransferase [Gammaproteobacteria bacterium]
MDSTLPSTLVCGRAAIHPLRGRSRNGRIVQSATLQVGEQKFLVRRAKPRLDANLKAGEHPLCGWEAEAVIRSDMAAEQVRVSIRTGDGRDAGSLEPSQIDIVERPALEQVQLPDSCHIVICMAAFNPQIKAFERQIISIQEQTYPHWHCIIQDDGSAPELLDAMRAVCVADDRFSFFSGEPNRGFYHNFERCLYRVPATVPYVALADQDDAWMPEKLQRLLDGLGQSTLVYSDMNIVDDRGQVLSETYWTKRRNNYRDMETVFLANTVTGAAALFRRELLDLALPFPIRIGDAFHDHWLALCAFTAGGVAYVQQPLYCYYQHAENVIGHCEEANPTRRKAAAPSTSKFPHRKMAPHGIMARIMRRLQGLEYGYQHEHRRLQLMARTLLLRQSQLPAHCRVVVDRLADDGWRCALFLLRSHLRVRHRGDTTGNAELRLFTWLVGHWLLVAFAWLVLTPYSHVHNYIRRI